MQHLINDNTFLIMGKAISAIAPIIFIGLFGAMFIKIISNIIKNKSYENINTTLLLIIAIFTAIFTISKLYEVKMMHDLMYFEPKGNTKIDEAFEKINKMQDEQLKQVTEQAKENLKAQEQLTNTTNNMMKKLSNVPQIETPKTQNQQVMNEEQKPHESSERKKIIIEVK